MTSLPYVAPWQTGFERYAVQQVKMLNSGPDAQVATIPGAEYWRIVTVQVAVHTDATVVKRFLELTITESTYGGIYSFAQPYTPTAGLTGFATWMPTTTAFGSDNGVDTFFTITSIPDAIWRYGTSFTVSLLGAGVGDTVNARSLILFEKYIEDYNPDTGAPTLVPTPVLA